MNRQGHNNTRLFVVGVQDHDLIEAAVIAHKCTHIYFGANQSFPTGRATSSDWTRWENMIMPFIGRGYWCTLDIDVTEAEGLLETGLTEYHKFIPMLSVKLPYIQQLGYNATIKLDDKDFSASNPGVWCHSVHKLMQRDNCFTDWSKYTNDEVIR